MAWTLAEWRAEVEGDEAPEQVALSMPDPGRAIPSGSGFAPQFGSWSQAGSGPSERWMAS